MKVTINIDDTLAAIEEPIVAAPISDSSPENSPTATGDQFYIQIIPEGRVTDDKRYFEYNSLEVRELPIPLMYQTITDEGHKNSVYVGSITNVWRHGSFIVGTGNFDDPKQNALAADTARIVAEGSFNRVSADLVDLEYHIDWTENDEGFLDVDRIVFTHAKVAGATIVAVSAFDEARITLGAPPEPDEALVASGTYPEGFEQAFVSPELDGPTPLTVRELDNGIKQVYGYVALWDTCHVGKAHSCVTAPKSLTNYGDFQTGLHDETPVGVITMDTGHAKVSLNFSDTIRHYDNTGTVAAYIQVHEDERGIMFCGYVEPTLDDVSIRRLTACSVSGDWRWDSTSKSLELVAVLAVPTPGFVTPRAFEAERGKQLSLVAAGTYCRPCNESMTVEEILDAYFGDSDEKEVLSVINKWLGE